MAEAHHRGHGKAQHLVGGAAPDAAQHGQKIPVAEFGRKALGHQKVTQRLHQGGLFTGLVELFRQRCGQAVEAQQVGQHAPEAAIEQVAALRKHRGQAGAAPLQLVGSAPARTGHLHRKRHVGGRNGHIQLRKQCQQVGIGALVEHQKTGVHTVGDGAVGGGQGDVHRVGVATEIVSGFEQRDPRQPAQRVRHGQTGDAGADHGHPQGTATGGGKGDVGDGGRQVSVHGCPRYKKGLRSAPRQTREGGRSWRTAPGLHGGTRRAGFAIQ